MQLRKAEALRMLDDHHRRLRHVDSHLNDGRRDQELRFSRCKARHHRIFVGAFHTAVEEIGRPAEALLQYPEAFLRRDEIDLLGFLDQRSEEHTSELQSQFHLVCRLLLEKKKKNNINTS